MKQQSISNIVLGGVGRPKLLLEMAMHLKTTPEYLLGETDDPTPIAGSVELFERISRLSLEGRRIVEGVVDTLEQKPDGKPPASPRRKAPRKSS